MAITGSYSTNTGVNLNLVAYYSYDQSVAANTSTVTVTLKLRHSSLYNNGLSGSYLSVAGNSVSYNKAISYSSTTIIETTLSTKTVTVTHNPNGTGSCNIKAYFAFNGTYGGQRITGITLNENLTLQTIPRISSITKITNASGTTISAIDSGSVVRVYWTPAASTYKYRVQCIVSGTTYTYPSTSTFYTPGSTSAFATPASGSGTITTAHSWLPNDSSGQVSVKLYTYDSAGAQIGNPQPGAFTLNVPSNILPSISAFTATVVDDKGGYYVQGNSKVTLSVTASKGSGAANIISYTFTGPNIDGSYSSKTISSNATSYSLTSSLLNYASTEQYYVTVTDSRRRSFKIANPISITAYQYSAPAISSITVQRCNSSGVLSTDGTYAYVTVNSTYSPINGANTRTVTLSNSSDNYVAKTTIQAASNTSGTYSGVYGGYFAIGSSYTIRATITDTAYPTPVSKDAALGTAKRPMNIAKYGNGVAIGGMSSVTTQNASGLFEVNWKSKMNSDVDVGGNIYMGGNGTQSTEQFIKFSNPSNSTYPHDCHIYGGNPNSSTDIGIWDAKNGRSVFLYNSAGGDGQGSVFILGQEYTQDTGWLTLNTEIKYRRKSGWVCVTGESSGSKTLTMNNYLTVGTLPTGFRPSISIPFTFHCTGGDAGGISAYITASGSIQMYTTKAGMGYWMFSVTFPL